MNDVTIGHGPTPNILTRAQRRARPLHMRHTMWLAHNSGRFDRPDSAWRRAFTHLTGQAIAITGTEASGRPDALFRAALDKPGWDYAHLSGAALGECYVAWDTTQFKPGGKPWAHKLTDKTWTRSEEYGGKQAAKVHALVVPLDNRLKRTVFVVVHMPLDNTPTRADIWVDCAHSLVALVRDLYTRFPNYTEVIVVMDGNKNLRDHHEAAMVREHLEKPLGMVTSWALGLPRSGGTEGRQVIDYALLRRPLLAACELLADLPDSDHRAFRYRLRGRGRETQASK